MNYFAHAFAFLDPNVEPEFIAGLAVPDWLNVVDRKIKARSRAAKDFLSSTAGRELANQQVAKGIIRHHSDDKWFHEGTDFNLLCLDFVVELRDLLAPDPGFRPSFLGHILVELFLDDFLIQNHRDKIERYYSAIDQVDGNLVEKIVSEISGQKLTDLDWFIRRFCEIRFLYDYSDNEKLLFRLNQIMHRVKLLPLPDHLFDFFDHARGRVAAHSETLFFEPMRQSLKSTTS